MINFVVVSSDLRPHVLDTRVKRGSELSTDHHLVVSWLRWWGRMLDRPGRTKRIVRVCWECLAESPVRRSFNSHLWESFGHVPGGQGTLGPSGPCSVPPLLRRMTGAVAARWLVPVVAAMPKPAGRHQRGDGVLLTSTRDVVDRWKEYFEDLINPTNAPRSEEAGPGDLGAGFRISGAEVAEVVIKLLGGKAPGEDEIRMEFLKAMDVVGLFSGTGEEGPLDSRTSDSGFNVVFVLGMERWTSRVFKGAWEFAQPVHMCFVDLEKAFDCVPRWGPVGGPPRVWGAGPPDTGRPLPVRSVSEFGPHSWQIGCLLFADDVVLLVSSARDLQRSLDRFAAECEAAGMRISTSKSEAMVLGRVKEEILPQVEEFKYLGVLFTSEGRMEQEIDRGIGAASAVMRTLHRSVVVKRELSQKAKSPQDELEEA
ncbi:hypothetical protein D4764_12G0007970 [Takifugu flavidus]|uniref:Reverse transcriptase domain-containing protein n=1 Tax=Takifugu flavidus TaxID=433684 RepID=A0A5C6PGD1_9TELE|nr:hypothetical protein D4764_12G0007970 [Takifugu flavidus]